MKRKKTIKLELIIDRANEIIKFSVDSPTDAHAHTHSQTLTDNELLLKN